MKENLSRVQRRPLPPLRRSGGRLIVTLIVGAAATLRLNAAMAALLFFGVVIGARARCRRGRRRIDRKRRITARRAELGEGCARGKDRKRRRENKRSDGKPLIVAALAGRLRLFAGPRNCAADLCGWRHHGVRRRSGDRNDATTLRLRLQMGGLQGRQVALGASLLASDRSTKRSRNCRAATDKARWLG